MKQNIGFPFRFSLQRYRWLAAAGAALILLLFLTTGLWTRAAQTTAKDPSQDAVSRNAEQMLAEGKQTFRYDTFGDEIFWGDTLKLHEAVAALSPNQALALGLKVDTDALPQDLIEALRRGEVDLNDPANTLLLLQLKAVVGVAGFFSSDGKLKSVGINCALCHSTVDDSLLPGLGHRLDGWANRDLNVGAIVASAPDLTPFVELLGLPDETIREVLNSWGPGKFDAELILDGKAFRPDGKTAATLIPSAFGLSQLRPLPARAGGGGRRLVGTGVDAMVASCEDSGVSFIIPLSRFSAPPPRCGRADTAANTRATAKFW